MTRAIAIINLANVDTILADMTTHETQDKYDRILAIGVIEHMKNYDLLLRKISEWMTPDGLLFIDYSCHKTFAYNFEVHVLIIEWWLKNIDDNAEAAKKIMLSCTGSEEAAIKQHRDKSEGMPRVACKPRNRTLVSSSLRPPAPKSPTPNKSLVFFRWDDTIPEDLIRATYDRLAGIRYTALMHKLKKKRVQPVYVIDEAWRRYLESWESEDFLARSSQATANRNTEVEGPGPGPSKHSGGSVSFVTTQERLAPEEMSGAHLSYTPDQSVDDEAVYLNVAGECPKGRVYGLGSLGRKKRRYADPGASTSEMPDMVPRAEFNVVAEQLRKVMEFMQAKISG
ncbi:hypothetical protein Sjap_022852 [Stephania japonica]|uniref:Uncharacterized protein n=1 Tax=Stephania japonica TaxID=461633 RepID=A0AAP0ES93_9MAGN